MNMLNAFAATALHFKIFRFLLGRRAGEFPGGEGDVGMVPMRVTAGGGIFNAGTALGAALAVPIILVDRADMELALGVRVLAVRSVGVGRDWTLATGGRVSTAAGRGRAGAD